MIRLLQIEMLKNLSYRPFKIFSILYFALIVLLLFIGLVDIQLSDSFTLNLKEQGIYNFPGIWNFTTYIVGLLKIFLGFIIIFSVTQEFSNRMFKQNIIDGLSRKEFLGSKLLTIGVFSLISTLLVLGISFYLGFTYSEPTNDNIKYEEIYLIANYFVKLFAFFSFLLFLSVLLRKAVFVFLTFFVWWIIEFIIGGLESFFFIKSITTEGKERTQQMIDHFYLSSTLPLESMSSLIPNPIMRLNIAKIFSANYEPSYPIESLIACIIWTLVFIAGSYLIMKKRDW